MVNMEAMQFQEFPGEAEEKPGFVKLCYRMVWAGYSWLQKDDKYTERLAAEKRLCRAELVEGVYGEISIELFQMRLEFYRLQGYMMDRRQAAQFDALLLRFDNLRNKIEGLKNEA